MLFLKYFWIVIWIFLNHSIHAETRPIASPASVSSSITPLSLPVNNIPQEEQSLLRDLAFLNYPPEDWRKELNQSEDESIYDVVIVGGGMAGLTVGTALFKEGIFNIKVFDQNPQGFEGPWMTYARMKTLRSNKKTMGIALEIPHLTFHAWFEVVYGTEAWKQMKKIPNHFWMEYLCWYRRAMNIPVENLCTLVDLLPTSSGGFELMFDQAGIPLKIKARKVVLATGRAGFGGPHIPDFAKDLPKSVYAHTIDHIDFDALKGRCVGIIGVGASSFDAAATALEVGAKKVDLIMRRSRLHNVNKFSSLPELGFSHGYFKLSDEKRWEIMCEAFKAGIPPPIESIHRIEGYPNLTILSNQSISQVHYEGSQIQIETNQGTYDYDFLILGTGFHIDGHEQPELRRVIDRISLWKDHLTENMICAHPRMANFPYLGPSYEFLPKQAGEDPYLRNLYCFNYGATMSHGLLSSDISTMSIGATRLAQGIAADFFLQNDDLYLDNLKKYQATDFEQENYLINIQ